MNRTDKNIRLPLLEVRDLSLSFQKQEQIAIDRVSFNITSGKTFGLVGASGAGKSSVARTITRLLEPDAGEILFRGTNLYEMDQKQLTESRQRIQLVFQDPSASLSPRRTVEQTLLEPLEHFSIGDTNYRSDKIRQTLGTVGLHQEALHRYPHQFSSGQQQRIAIARALVTEPDLLIADEPVSSLDVSIQAQILQLIQTLQKDHGITFLFITHDLAVIRQIADDIGVMYRGQMLEQAPADMFFSNPAHPYSKALLSFARDEIPAPITGDKWLLDRGRTKNEALDSCVFTHNCTDKISICERQEPALQHIQYKNHHASSPHCVKCHLYEKANSNET
jgi:oligopeptide/dipeptide ABC transporter ATP-binding protein